MADQTIQCIDCSASFTFNEGEQQFYADKGLKPPRRCKTCRANRKANGGFHSKSEQRRVNTQRDRDLSAPNDGYSDEL